MISERNSICKFGFLHNYKIIKSFHNGVLEQCDRCKNKRFFRNDTPNHIYLSHHIRSILQPYNKRFSKEYAKDNLHIGKPEKQIQGIIKAVVPIESSYGAAGGNHFEESSLYPYFKITNDGKDIMDSIKLDDPLERGGVNVLKEAADRAEKDSKGGRKTTMILTKAILQESLKVDAQPMEIKRSLEECLPILIKSIDDQKRPIELKDIKSVALTSSESEEIAQVIHDAYQVIGKEGIIEVDHSNLPNTFFEVLPGVKLRGAKCFGPFAYTDSEKASYSNPLVLITKDKISTTDQLDPLFKELKRQGRGEIVIYFDEIDLSVASKIANLHIEGGIKTLLIKSPTLWKDWFYEDLAKMTGATIVDSKQGKTFKNLSMADLGTCEKIVSNSEETYVMGIKDISEHVKSLEERGLVDEQLKLRASWLNTKVAVLKVGANSETELYHKTKKARDAASEVFLALKEGIVPGGGKAIMNCWISLPKDSLGADILRASSDVLARTIVSNTGNDFDKIIWTIPGVDGFNARTRKEVQDLFIEGIVDPAIVVKNAIKNAISIASTVLTVRSTTLLPEIEVHHVEMRQPNVPMR